MNTFNISFLSMEISILDSFSFFFSFSHHLVELGSFLASKAIKGFQPAADAEQKDKRNGTPGGIKTVIIYNYTTHNPFIATCPLIYSRSRAHMSVGFRTRFPPSL